MVKRQAANALPSNPVVLIPAFNEEGVVGRVIASVRAVCPYPVIVIDDASTDGTRTEAESAGALVLPLVANLGAWGATQTGIRYALKHGFDLAISLDADGQHDPSQINSVAAPVLNGLAHVSIGAYPERGSRARQVAWILLRAVSGIRLEDLTSGFRAYGFDAMRELASWRATYLDFQDVGVLSLLMDKGLRVMDVAVTMRKRENGHSRIFRTWLAVGYYMCHTVLLGVTKRRIRRYRGMLPSVSTSVLSETTTASNSPAR
ncbi:MAG: glycosyltransferase family 2 protein [Pseudomonadota bacterium]